MARQNENLTFKTPIQVGGIDDGITVDQMELVSISINWQPKFKLRPGGAPGQFDQVPHATVSVMLQHMPSGWTHTITLTDAEGDAHRSAILAAIPDLEKTILNLLAAKLPAGTVG